MGDNTMKDACIVIIACLAVTSFGAEIAPLAEDSAPQKHAAAAVEDSVDEEAEAAAERKADLARIAKEDDALESEKEDEKREAESAQATEALIQVPMSSTPMADETMPPEWRRIVNPEGREYYWNTKSGYTTWHKPDVSTGQHRVVAKEEATWKRENNPNAEEEEDISKMDE